MNHIQQYTLADVYLIGMSLWFYGSFGWEALAVLCISIVLNYICGRCISKFHKIAAAAGVVINLLLLFVLKYIAPIEITDVWSLVMPVGFSFYTFSQISYLIDRMNYEASHNGARGERRDTGTSVPHAKRGDAVQDDVLTYLLWATYFPKLVEGPIVRYQELRDQLVDTARRRFDGERFCRGVVLFCLGMGKKVLLADHLAPVADYGFSVLYLDTISMIAVMLSYALQLYYDFSGFCDMAMGIGWMMNIELPVNFDSPYKVTSFGQFWGKWHMTLTRFLTTYVYIPLGGSRRGRVRTIVNVLIVFALSGIWHGEAPHYLVWGLLTGVLVVIYNQLRHAGPHVTQKAVAAAGAGQDARRGKVALQRAVIMIVFCLTLFFFRAESVGNALIMLRYLFRPLWPGWITTAASQLSFDELYVVEKAVQMVAPTMLPYVKLAELLVLLAISLRLVYGRRNAREIAETCRLNSRNAIFVALILVWCMISFSGVSTFLYFKY